MNFLITGLETFETKKKCVPRDLWLGFAAYFTVVDMVITMLLPFIIISITNTLITIKLLGVTYQRRRNKKKRNSSAKKNEGFASKIPLVNVERITHEDRKINDLTYAANNLIVETCNYELNACTDKTTSFISKIIGKKYANIIEEKKKSKQSLELSKVVFKSTNSLKPGRNQLLLNRTSMANASKREKVYSRTTKMLLSLSTMFLILVNNFFK
jgi:hypothetical protein